MKPTHSEDWVVARKRGQRLFLSGGHSKPLTFENMSSRVLFFQEGDFDKEVAKLGIEASQIVKEPVTVSIEPRPHS